ncbi:MAG: TonB-dependent receptor [Rikenellaceae bacterium]|nr:TonB-dependent receptor [Rikenellaceae bacterium]
MKKLLLITIISIVSYSISFAQTVEGYVYDDQTKKPLVGTTVTYTVRGEYRGVTTDAKGFYSLPVPDGGTTIIYSFVGYAEQSIPVVVSEGNTVTRNIYMEQSVQLLENVVVSAGRFEQKLNEVTVSMEVMSANAIERQVPTDLGVALNTLPGVDINDGQPSIRGGSGWTYGVGSRSLMLLDGMSVLGAANGEINWSMIPMENIEQVEVIKGASSVLYGSSALNGLINIRSGRPGIEPKTTIKYYVGVYDNPSNSDYIWWDKAMWTEGKFAVKSPLRNSVYSGVRNPMFEGIDFSHTRRIGDFDVSAGLNMLTDEGYREQGYRKRFRIGGNVTYYQPSDNIINYGANYNFVTDKSADFLVWRSATEALQPSAVTNMAREGNTFSIDPFFNFVNLEKNSSHRIRGRFMYEADNILSGGASKSILEILGNMGTDITSLSELGNLLSPEILLPILDGNVENIVDGLFDILGSVFPTATTADYMDLIGWIMNNWDGNPLSDLSNTVSWLSDVGKDPKTYVDENFTYYLDYQFHKDFGGAKITTGATYDHVTNKSSFTGTHRSDNVSLYLQYDQRFFDRLSVSAGVRGEYYRVDDHYREAETKMFGVKVPFKPIFRGGLNYQAADYTFIRASFGQGYRYPSIVEKFARKDIGGVGVFPNHNLKEETGFNAEIGVVQGYKIGRFQGFLDVAGFYTQYKNMVEFNIGFFNNDTYEHVNSLSMLIDMMSDGQMPGLGAQFYNIDKAQIYGVDISTNGTFDIAPGMRFLYNIGYVYLEPRDPDYKKKNEIEDQITDPLTFKEKSNPSKYLKYRQKHTFKGSIDYEWNRFTIGTNITVKSKTLAVDYIFLDERGLVNGQYGLMDYVREILLGNTDGKTFETYWEKNNKSYFVMDLRAGVKVTDKLNFQFMISNLFNKEYSYRPMALAPQRTYVMTVSYSF